MLSYGGRSGYAFASKDASGGLQLSVTFDGVDLPTIQAWLIGCIQLYQYEQRKIVVGTDGMSAELLDGSRAVALSARGGSRNFIAADNRYIHGARDIIGSD